MFLGVVTFAHHIKFTNLILDKWELLQNKNTFQVLVVIWTSVFTIQA